MSDEVFFLEHQNYLFILIRSTKFSRSDQVINNLRFLFAVLLVFNSLSAYRFCQAGETLKPPVGLVVVGVLQFVLESPCPGHQYEYSGTGTGTRYPSRQLVSFALRFQKLRSLPR